MNFTNGFSHILHVETHQHLKYVWSVDGFVSRYRYMPMKQSCRQNPTGMLMWFQHLLSGKSPHKIYCICFRCSQFFYVQLQNNSCWSYFLAFFFSVMERKCVEWLVLIYEHVHNNRVEVSNCLVSNKTYIGRDDSGIQMTIEINLASSVRLHNIINEKDS